MFKKAFDHILRVEGDEFVCDPKPTRMGITQGTFTRWLKSKQLPLVSVEEITREEAYAIYRDEYWIRAQCPRLPWPIACYHFDGYVNLLPRDAGRV